MGVQGSTSDPKHPGGSTLEQQAQWVTMSTAGNLAYLYGKGQNVLRSKKCTYLSLSLSLWWRACAVVTAHA
jgi:hypothetical protein